MKAKIQSHLSFFRKGYEIPGKIKFLEAIASFELTKPVIKPVRISEIGNLSLRTAFDSFRQKRIVRCHITTGDLRDYLSEKCVPSRVGKHNEAHQLLAQICSKNLFSKQVTTELTLYSLEVLAIVQKASSLPNRSFVED